MKRVAEIVAHVSLLLLAAAGLAGEPILRIEHGPQRPEMPVLSWDTEGGQRAQTNLLRSDQALSLRIRVAGQWRPGIAFPCRTEPSKAWAVMYRITVAPGAEVLWNLRPGSNRLTMDVSTRGTEPEQIEELEILFPFDPKVTPTTVLPAAWDQGGSLEWHCLLSP